MSYRLIIHNTTSPGTEYVHCLSETHKPSGTTGNIEVDSELTLMCKIVDEDAIEIIAKLYNLCHCTSRDEFLSLHNRETKIIFGGHGGRIVCYKLEYINSTDTLSPL